MKDPLEVHVPSIWPIILVPLAALIIGLTIAFFDYQAKADNAAECRDLGGSYVAGGKGGESLCIRDGRVIATYP